MNIGQLNIPLQNKILQTYSVGKFSKTLYEKDSDSKYEVQPKTRSGVFISISDKAKELYQKFQQVGYQHSTPIEQKTNTFKSVFEKVNNDFDSSKFEKKSKTNRKRTQQQNQDLEDYLNPEKLGFVVSGNISETSEPEEYSPSEKLLQMFESDSNREPGNLVNVLV